MYIYNLILNLTSLALVIPRVNGHYEYVLSDILDPNSSAQGAYRWSRASNLATLYGEIIFMGGAAKGSTEVIFICGVAQLVIWLSETQGRSWGRAPIQKSGLLWPPNEVHHADILTK